MSEGQDMPRRRIETPCTIEIEHSAESLHAFVELDGDIEIRPGDQVIVHDAPTDIAPGEKRVLRGRATVIQATWWERIWTRIQSAFELNELYDVSFTERRRL